jgi:cobaltochelatase CobN
MHRLAATPGGWNPDLDGVIFVEQTPAPIVILTAADTDIQTLATSIVQLPQDFPAVRVANLLQLQQQLTIDTYAEDVLEFAQVIVLRLLGGQSYWSYGLEVVQETVEKTGAKLIVVPGDDRPDPNLISHSTLPLPVVDQVWRYFTEGGIENIKNGLRFLANVGLDTDYAVQSAIAVPRVGIYNTQGTASDNSNSAGLLFYRSHYLSGNTAPIDALCQALCDRNINPIPVFISSLRDRDLQTDVLSYFSNIQVLINTTSFAMPDLDLWQQLDIPVLQVILSGGTVETWQSGTQGLSPRDTAMNVALPEIDGRIITRAVSFKAVQTRHETLQTDVVNYQPVRDRIEFTADLAANWIHLRQTPIADRRISLILANYPTRDGRLANGVGLDTPASCVEILKALQKEGYTVTDFPETGDELIQKLTQGVTNDPEGKELRRVPQHLALKAYQHYFETLPEPVRQQILQRWNLPTESFAISGLQFGNVFVGIQPARGYDLDPSLNYHAPDLEPTHAYLAFYNWVRSHFQTDAIVHVGKHGNLEWLPGKSLALSETCYPEIALGALPHFYPFIVNDPGEGSQAKRRSQAVIIDHLTPPMTRAELYGGLQKLEALIDEYYEAQTLDPSRLSVIRDRIQALMLEENLHQELNTLEESIENVDRYLCELKEAQIRDGLHIFGQCPEGRQLRDLMVAIARHPQPGRQGLTRALAEDLGLDFDPLTVDPVGEIGDAIADLEEKAASLVETLPLEQPLPKTQAVLQWIQTTLLPNLKNTSREITNLLHGLEGGYIPSAPSGAPTRGRPEVLPTGRNFYSVDIRAIPTESAWDVGRKAAEALVERYTQDHGEYPQTLGLSVWGTSTMRTGGDDLAEALALLGVQPVWEGSSRRVIDFEILPLSLLGRPRIDVTLRISGFFRDAFPNLIDLFDQAVTAVSHLNEPADQNPLAAKVRQETDHWQQQGLTLEQANRRSRYRIFGSKPGAYGAGLQGLIEAQNWSDEADLAQAYINWSSYAYVGSGVGHAAPEAFNQRLQNLQIVLHNQDNREHDLLDSDDYYQFQGGLTVAVRSKGKAPATYFGDHALPENPKVRSLKEQIARVYRSRVINPKWIEGVMRHGYKGAFEIAATVDYLFAYDATARCVEDYMYQGVAEAYLFDQKVQNFIEQKNPWALRDMAERLLEAHQRGLWQRVTEDTRERLRAIALQAEGEIETRPM